MTAQERIQAAMIRLKVDDEAALAAALGLAPSTISFYRIHNSLPVDFGLWVEIAAVEAEADVGAADPIGVARQRVNAALTALSAAISAQAFRNARAAQAEIERVRTGLEHVQ